MYESLNSPLTETVRSATRSAGVDAVRVLGIVAVVAGHVWTDRTAQLLLYTWHVPVFFFLTGYFWKTRRPLGEEIRKRFSTLVLPYLSWLLLISLAFVPLMVLGSQPTPLFDYLRILLGGSYLGRPYSAFWFVSALFFTAVALRLLQRPPFAAQAGIAVALLAAASLLPDLFRAIPLGIGTGLGSLVFVVAGAALRRLRTRITAPVLLGSALLVASAAAVAFGWSAPLDLKQADFGTPVLSVAVAIAISSGLILLAEHWVPRLGAAAGRGIIAVAGCGLMVILSHAAVLWVLRMHDEGSAPYFLAALLVPWGAALLVRRTALAPLLIGAPRSGRGPAGS